MKTKNITTPHWFAAIFGCGLMLITLGTASAQQPLRPQLILDVDAPQEVNAQPNFVMAQPLAPFAIPFRSTMGESDYAPLSNARTVPTLLALPSRFRWRRRL